VPGRLGHGCAPRPQRGVLTGKLDQEPKGRPSISGAGESSAEVSPSGPGIFHRRCLAGLTVRRAPRWPSDSSGVRACRSRRGGSRWSARVASRGPVGSARVHRQLVHRILDRLAALVSQATTLALVRPEMPSTATGDGAGSCSTTAATNAACAAGQPRPCRRGGNFAHSTSRGIPGHAAVPRFPVRAGPDGPWTSSSVSWGRRSGSSAS
jgi:hypothetical protein